MILLADFGNTRVKVALGKGNSLDVIYNGPVVLRDMQDAVKGMDIEGGMWCSVHEIEASVRTWMESLGVRPLLSSTRIPIRNAYRTPGTLGMDRLAAAAGAWSMESGHDMLIIDAGTAVTFDFVTKEGVFKGGNIAPGVALRFQSLHEHTGALPLVQADGETPLLGYDTRTAIRSGVLNGIRYEAEGCISELESLYPALLVFLTGGDADFFDIKAKSRIFAVPDLVLRGLARIVEYNEKGL